MRNVRCWLTPTADDRLPELLSVAHVSSALICHPPFVPEMDGDESFFEKVGEDAGNLRRAGLSSDPTIWD